MKRKITVLQSNSLLRITVSFAVFTVGLLPSFGVSDWYEYNGHFYGLTENSYYGIHDSGLNSLGPDVFDAEIEAQSVGGHLVTINDLAENTWLSSVFNDRQYWIGFTDYGSEGNWFWLSGEAVTFTNWDVSQPDDGNVGEDSATFNHFSVNNPNPIGVWNDLGNASYSNHTQLPTQGIIEVGFHPKAVPDASSTLSLVLISSLSLAALRKFYISKGSQVK